MTFFSHFGRSRMKGKDSDPSEDGIVVGSKDSFAIADHEVEDCMKRCHLVLVHIDVASRLQDSLQEVLASIDLTESQFKVLAVLLEKHPEPLSASELAVNTIFSRASISDTVEQLVQDGLVTRTRNPKNRRSVFVQLTPDGEAMADRALQIYLKEALKLSRYVETRTIEELLDSYARLKAGVGE